MAMLIVKIVKAARVRIGALMSAHHRQQLLIQSIFSEINFPSFVLV
jgi:hypothetical protein